MNTQPASEPVTPAQIPAIWAAGRAAGLDREGIYDVVEQVSGFRSVTRLTKEEARQIIDRLNPRRPRRRSHARTRAPAQGTSGGGPIPAIPSPGQRAYARKLIEELERTRGIPFAQGVVEKAIAKSTPLTSQDYQRVIEAMKALGRRCG
ncbi:MAG: hypothetical protein KIT79_12765 [Deltaproteobacteria bacterium]|nr:hypothetical protein [Deltaproteobacteria bacterium]